MKTTFEIKCLDVAGSAAKDKIKRLRDALEKCAGNAVNDDTEVWQMVYDILNESKGWA